MEFGSGFWGPLIATAAMLLGAAVAGLILLASRRIAAPKPSPSKLTSYGCGEEVKPEEAQIDSEQFYSPIRRVFRPFYRYVRPAHTGILSHYLLGVLIGFFIILLTVFILLR